MPTPISRMVQASSRGSDKRLCRSRGDDLNTALEGGVAGSRGARHPAMPISSSIARDPAGAGDALSLGETIAGASVRYSRAEGKLPAISPAIAGATGRSAA